MNNKSDICVIKDELIRMLQTNDLKEIDTHEAYEIVDMIKDLAETEYYCKVTEAMEKADYGYDEEFGPMGYNSNRSARTGRYMSGSGYRPMVDQEPYIREYLEHPNQRINWNAMGYTPESMNETNQNNRYGMAYDNYRTARRHYTATKSETDKLEMKEHANKHLMETVATLREIWDHAEPDMRKRMKSDLQNLVAEMNI